MKAGWLVLLCPWVLAHAQPGIAPPRIGFVLKSDGSVRPLVGLAGNLVLGDSVFRGVLSSGSSASWMLLKTSSSLIALDLKKNIQFSSDMNDGIALFAFDQDGRPALACLPRSNTLLEWRTDHFQSIPFAADLLDGDPIAISRPADNWVRFVIRRSDGLWRVDLSMQDGAILSQSALPGIQGPVLLQSDGSLVYVDQTSLIVGARRIELGFAGEDLRPMGNGWIQVGQLAVRITAGREQVSQIPEVAPCCEN